MLPEKPISPEKGTKRYRRADASEYLLEAWGISRTPKTLAKEAVNGGGPVMEYDGRIPLYTTNSLDEYATRALSAPVKSTAELRMLKATKTHTQSNPVGEESSHG
jgi:hypothetical protein